MTKAKQQTEETPSVPPVAIAGLTEGRIVHFVMPNGQHRPAIIVQVWDHGSGMSNLQVFMDGNNDGFPLEQATQWAGSIFYDEAAAPGTWHFIERVE